MMLTSLVHDLQVAGVGEVRRLGRGDYLVKKFPGLFRLLRVAEQLPDCAVKPPICENIWQS